MLHNFIYGKSKNARRKGKASIFVSSPQPTVLSSRSSTRPRSPSSPASFASPEIFDIHERDHGSFDYVPRAFQVPDDDQMYDSYEESDNEHRQSEKHKPSPKVQLEFDSEPPLSEIFSQAMRGEGTEMLTSSGSGSGSGDGSGSRAAALSEEQLVIEPTGTNTTNFIDYSDDEKPRRNGLTTGPSYRKPPPAPIQIPEHAMKGPQVHVQHTASLKSSDQNNSTDRNAGPSDSRDAYLSRPPSTMSTDEFSAVSGTTLARALIANSFILSSDPRASRHRSGVMRQDSATLPRGESPMLNSPYWRDRRVSTSSMVMTPDTGRTSPIPPVPPMPGFVKGASASGNAATLARRRSTSAASLQEEMGAGLVRSSSTHSRLEVGEYQASRRISRISEAPSPAPSAPSTPQRTPLSGRSINGEQSSIVSPSLRRTSPSPTFETEQEQHMQSTGADRDSVSTEGVEREHTPDRESTTPVQEQEMEVPDDIRNLLQNYQFVSPLPSATSDQSASATAPPSPLSNTAPTKRSSKKIRSGKVILPTGPSGKSRLIFSIPSVLIHCMQFRSTRLG
ncbi:hypothetical protein PLICRDRAFT_519724 [Plicaturopsis crispa FD-325 SS-3]|nr:hypothetical protein PLICRDRAFT_519724 [Plicaturopsis crispa FD-325 SS-3]